MLLIIIIIIIFLSCVKSYNVLRQKEMRSEDELHELTKQHLYESIRRIATIHFLYMDELSRQTFVSLQNRNLFVF